MSSFKTVEWMGDRVRMIDQRRLPVEEVYVDCYTYEDVARCIKEMVIRGAPAIGVAAAMGVALGALKSTETEKEGFIKHLEHVSRVISKTRPTAVNLFWALKRMNALVEGDRELHIPELKELLVREAKAIYEEDIRVCKQIGRNGAALLEDGMTVMTHCNAGALATAGYGTALGVIRAAVEEGKRIGVVASETRPYLQGSRLTAWELAKDGIGVTIITDNTAGYAMSRAMVDAVIVGADRIASNGDVANKIGTYSLSVLAKNHGIPFYVAAPMSTVDFGCRSGEDIPIEERSPREVSHINGKKIAADVEIFNPAFDVTPHENVRAIITEEGVFEEPYAETLASIGAKKG